MNYTFKIKLPKLLYFYDKSSALNGIEGRVPMLDHKYVEFIFQIMIDLKLILMEVKSQ